MFDFLSAYLEGTVTPEQRRVVLDGCYALVEVGISDHEFLIDQELEKTDQLDSDTVIQQVTEMVLPMLRQVIGEFGVRLTEDVTLAQATDILRALQRIENYEDQDTILGLTESSDGSEAALADILELMGQFSSAEYLGWFERVSPALLERIEETCSKENDPLLPNQSIRDAARFQMQLYLSMAPVQAAAELLAVHALEEGLHFGLPLELVIAPYRARLESLDSQRLALELMGFLCASNTDINDFRKVAGQQLELIHADLTKITAVDVAVTKLIDQLRATYAGLNKAGSDA